MSQATGFTMRLIISYHPDPTSPSSRRVDVLQVDPPVYVKPSCYRLVGALPNCPKEDQMTRNLWHELPNVVERLWAEGGAQAVLYAFPDRCTFVAREDR